jgi:hypothetical protein
MSVPHRPQPSPQARTGASTRGWHRHASVLELPRVQLMVCGTISRHHRFKRMEESNLVSNPGIGWQELSITTSLVVVGTQSAGIVPHVSQQVISSSSLKMNMLFR